MPAMDLSGALAVDDEHDLTQRVVDCKCNHTDGAGRAAGGAGARECRHQV